MISRMTDLLLAVCMLNPSVLVLIWIKAGTFHIGDSLVQFFREDTAHYSLVYQIKIKSWTRFRYRRNRFHAFCRLDQLITAHPRP